MTSLCVLRRTRVPLTADDIVDGGSANTFYVLQGILKRGIPVEVFTCLEDGQQAVIEEGHLTVWRVPYKKSTKVNPMEKDFDEGQSFVQSVIRHRAFNPNRYLSLHTHHWSAAIGLTDHMPRKLPYIHTPHLLAVEKIRYAGFQCPVDVLLAEQRVLHRADRILALSQSQARVLFDQYKVQLSQVLVVHNGVSSHFFDVQVKETSSNSFLEIACTARICRQKGIDVLLDAVEILLRSVTNVRLSLIGDYYNESDYTGTISQRLRTSPLKDHVLLYGQVPHETVSTIIRNADLYVQPSRYESQGIALLEAMATSLAVIASDLPAIREYITSEYNGLLVEPECAESLADAVLFLHKNPDVRLRLGLAARLTASAYSWQTTIDRTVATLIS